MNRSAFFQTEADDLLLKLGSVILWYNRTSFLCNWDAAVISSILKEAGKVDDVPPFAYPCERRSDRMELQEDEWER